MKLKIATSCCLAVSLLLLGCGPGSGNLAPVKGTLLIDGSPVEGVDVVFSPQASGENGNPGPWSDGVTDAEGKFELKSRYGNSGAVIGTHDVVLEYPDLEPGAMDVLREELANAKTSGEEGAAEAAQEVIDQMQKLKKKLKGRVMIPALPDSEIDVPAAGLPNLVFDLKN